MSLHHLNKVTEEMSSRGRRGLEYKCSGFLFKFASISFITFELNCPGGKEKELNSDTNCVLEIIDILDRIQVIMWLLLFSH